MTIHDLGPQLANCRDHFLGYGKSDRSDGDLTLYRSDISNAFLNGVLELRGGSLDGAFADAKERLDGVPWLWWVGPDSDPAVADGLLARSATQAMTLPVMTVRTDRVHEVAEPPGLSIEEVTGHDALGEYVAAYAPPFEVFPDQVDPLVALEESRLDASEALVRFAGRVVGRVVGTSALFDRDGVAGIYFVAAAEGHRRRGPRTRLACGDPASHRHGQAGVRADRVRDGVGVPPIRTVNATPSDPPREAGSRTARPGPDLDG